MIALVDVNNFYVSCERLFNPYLHDKPVVVLSNNDGCIISRSQEAKDLGIKMGQPLFKVKALLKHHHVQVLSSNYSLYADISDRVMTLLSEFTDIQEVYSIDECFLNMNGQDNLGDIAHKIRVRMWQYLRMPVCVGIGPTKVLAKLANRCAKKDPYWQGVFVTDNITKSGMHSIMRSLPIDQLWGVGKSLSLKLQTNGVFSILDLKKANPIFMRKKFSINIEKIIYELNDIVCFELEQYEKKKKEIRCSRSFGKSITQYHDLKEAITTFASRAAFKSRMQETASGMITIFVTTNPFNKKDTNYSASISLAIEPPTRQTMLIIKVALRGLSKIYKENITYSKCGVILSNLMDVEKSQNILSFLNKRQNNVLTFVMDEINSKFEKDSIRIGTQPRNPSWKMKQLHKSQSYTTSWDDLLCVG